MLHRGEQRVSARKRRSGISRRMLLQAGALMSAYPAPQLLAQTPEPLKIGFLTVLTGPLAAGGQQQEEGAGLFLNERNGMSAGRDKNAGIGRTPQGSGHDRPAGDQ